MSFGARAAAPTRPTRVQDYVNQRNGGGGDAVVLLVACGRIGDMYYWEGRRIAKTT